MITIFNRQKWYSSQNANFYRDTIVIFTKLMVIFIIKFFSEKIPQLEARSLDLSVTSQGYLPLSYQAHWTSGKFLSIYS